MLRFIISIIIVNSEHLFHLFAEKLLMLATHEEM